MDELIANYPKFRRKTRWIVDLQGIAQTFAYKKPLFDLEHQRVSFSLCDVFGIDFNDESLKPLWDFIAACHEKRDPSIKLTLTECNTLGTPLTEWQAEGTKCVGVDFCQLDHSSSEICEIELSFKCQSLVCSSTGRNQNLES